MLFAMQASAASLAFSALPGGAYFDRLANSSDQGFSFANENGSRWFWNANQDGSAGRYNGVGGSIWLGVNVTNAPSGIVARLASAIPSDTDFVFDGPVSRASSRYSDVLSLGGARAGQSGLGVCRTGRGWRRATPPHEALRR